MTRVLITGVAGQDGSYLAETLLARDVEVHALLLGHDDRRGVPDDVITHVGDVADIAATRALLHELVPDRVYNLAAISSVAHSWEWPDLSALVNGTAAVALLESAHQVQTSSGHHVRFIQASSAEIFGQPEQSPQDEWTPIRPINPYGAAKAYAHLMVGVYRSRGLHASSLILYNHESPRRPASFVTRKITQAVAAIAGGSTTPLTLGNLEARRDWGWAPDVVDALVAAGEAPEGADYVIATGISHSIRDFARVAFAHVGIADWEKHVVIDQDLVRPADATELVGDSTLAERELGWSPSIPFEEIVARMVDKDRELLREHGS